MSSDSTSKKMTIDVSTLGDHHPSIRAEDWISPLIRRLLAGAEYRDGRKEFKDSFRGDDGDIRLGNVELIWEGRQRDYQQVFRTYQEPVLTEFATLGLACILTWGRADLEITEVTRRGDKADYWLGNKELLLEVSGTEGGDLDRLCKDKSEQLLANPFRRDGFVCVCSYQTDSVRLWFYRQQSA